MDIASLRNEYAQLELDEISADVSPIRQFEKWFGNAVTVKIREPNGMVLSTVSSANVPSQRTVLMKRFDDEGFVFYTNYKSRKANEIANNQHVSLIFPWYELERQVIITGTAHKVSAKDSLRYFTTRPRGSQLGAWVSQQSDVITSRNILLTKLAEMKRKFKDGQIPLPDHWGGFCVNPVSIEFWQGRPDRLHDRLLYEKIGDDWKISRLSP